MEPDDAILVLTTAGSRDEAATIAASLVESRLAACVQVVPGIESFYRWEGAVAHDAEWLLLCKTAAGRYADVERLILASHSYTTPEVVAVRIEEGASAYLDWLRRSVA
jgi:periplasmic divalent cation tolerance protein